MKLMVDFFKSPNAGESEILSKHPASLKTPSDLRGQVEEKFSLPDRLATRMGLLGLNGVLWKLVLRPQDL